MRALAIGQQFQALVEGSGRKILLVPFLFVSLLYILEAG